MGVARNTLILGQSPGIVEEYSLSSSPSDVKFGICRFIPPASGKLILLCFIESRCSRVKKHMKLQEFWHFSNFIIEICRDLKTSWNYEISIFQKLKKTPISRLLELFFARLRLDPRHRARVGLKSFEGGDLKPHTLRKRGLFSLKAPA